MKVKATKDICKGITDLDDEGEGNWNEVQKLLQYIGRYKIEKELLEPKETE